MTKTIRDLLAEIPMTQKKTLPFDRKIYRILEKEHFFEMFEKKENTLVLPHMWDDPFENLLRRVILENITEEGEIERGKIGLSLKYGIYAQCWGAHKVPDAMWHIYSNKTEAVQIETTVGKLISSMPDRCKGNFCCDEVEYLNEEKLEEFIKGIRFDTDTIKSSFFKKRKAFKHEREIRLIYIGSNNTDRSKYTCKYSIEPHELIDRVIINPRACPCEYARFKEEIEERTNLNCERIKHSTLYQEPTRLVSSL